MERVLVSIDRKQLLRFIRFLRRFSLKWVSALLSIAFILASGLSLYMTFVFLPVGKSPRPKAQGNESLRLDTKRVSKADQEIILGRNIFNSEGKLGDAIDGPARSGSRASDKLVKSDLPLKLTGVIFAGDPFNGLAMIENTQKRSTSSYMVGDSIQDDAKLVEVYDDRIILERQGGREYVELEKFVMPAPKRKGQEVKPGTSGGVSLDRLASKPPPEAYHEDGFERKGMTIKLTDEFKRNMLAPEMLTKVLQDAKAEPNMVGGELKGFRLTRIRENSVYEKAGFQNNDIIEEINGIPLRDAAGAIRLLNQLRSEKDIEVRLNRNGSIQNMQIQIQ